MRRSLAAIPLALSALLLLAASAVAGGWADIRADATTADDPPVAGQPLAIGFTVLQHGVTPVSWVTPIVTARDLVSGATIDVPVAPSGPEGHFAGSFTPTQAGYWTWSVQLQDLLSDPFTVAVAVQGVDGTIPTLDAAQLINAAQGASQDLRLQLEDRMGTEYAMIEQRFARLATLDDHLDREVRALADQRDALATRVGALEAAAGGGATPAGSPIAMVLLAVLAGATAGFAMSWLAGRPGVRAAAVSDPATPVPAGAAPRGSTPA